MNKTLLTIIALGVIVIAGTLVYQATKKSPEEKIADSISNTAKDISNSINN
jgi:sensor domain CHASE-containing protein